MNNVVPSKKDEKLVDLIARYMNIVDHPGMVLADLRDLTEIAGEIEKFPKEKLIGQDKEMFEKLCALHTPKLGRMVLISKQMRARAV